MTANDQSGATSLVARARPFRQLVFRSRYTAIVVSGLVALVWAPATWASVSAGQGPSIAGYAETGAGVLPSPAGVETVSGVAATASSGSVAPGRSASADDGRSVHAPADPRSLVEAAHATAGDPSVAASAGSGALPYTGFDLVLLLAAAFVLLATGLVLRRVGRAAEGDGS